MHETLVAVHNSSTVGAPRLWRRGRGWSLDRWTKRWCGLGWPLCTSTGSARISVYQWEYSVRPSVI